MQKESTNDKKSRDESAEERNKLRNPKTGQFVKRNDPAGKVIKTRKEPRSH